MPAFGNNRGPRKKGVPRNGVQVSAIHEQHGALIYDATFTGNDILPIEKRSALKKRVSKAASRARLYESRSVYYKRHSLMRCEREEKQVKRYKSTLPAVEPGNFHESAGMPAQLNQTSELLNSTRFTLGKRADIRTKNKLE